MKFIILSLALSFISTAAMACPQISGAYKCNFNGKEEIANYATRVENGVYYYKIDMKDIKGEVPADGLWRQYGSNPDVSLALTCSGANLSIISQMTKVSGDLANFACAGSGVKYIDGQSTWTVQPSQIDQDNKAQIYCGNGNVLNLDGDYSCVKM